MNQKHSYLLKNNGFDILRHLLALTVVLVHTSELTGIKAYHWFEQTFSSGFAVKSFFVLSGFLIFMSYDRNPDLKNYFLKRFKRIYPGYLTVILLSAVGLSVFHSPGIKSYFLNTHWFKYIASNLFFLNFLEPTVPSSFQGHIFPAVNGALWTLKVEVMFYITVPLVVYLFKFGRLKVLISLFILSLCYTWVMDFSQLHYDLQFLSILKRQLPGQLSFFIVGALGYYYLDELIEKRFIAAGIWVCLTIFMYFFKINELEPFVIGGSVFFLGFTPILKYKIKNLDLSYGIYILHFPIIQILISTGTLHNEQALRGLFLIFGFTILGALLLWYGIEKPFLKRK